MLKMKFDEERDLNNARMTEMQTEVVELRKQLDDKDYEVDRMREKFESQTAATENEVRQSMTALMHEKMAAKDELKCNNIYQ